MQIGETYSWVPTSWEGSNGIVSALGKKGEVHGRIVYINEDHRYFTAEANVGGVGHPREFQILRRAQTC